MHLSRKISSVVAGMTMAAAGFTGVGLAVAPGANAATPAATQSTSCSSATATATLSPGIYISKNPSKKTTIKATFTASKCKAVSGATSTKGNITMTSKNLRCVSGSASGTFTAKSNKGKTSSGTMSLAATSTPLEFTLSGKVTKGFLDGSKISGKFKATPVTGNCTSKALTKATIKNDGSFKL